MIKGSEHMIRKKVVIYLRLSKEDGDSESMSISNQRKILHEYAKHHNLEIVGEYVDDGVSGYTMNRPSFNRLKNDLNKDLVEVILVKDLSRLGRNDAHVQLFITNIVECDKQVISLGENFDSRNESCLDTLGIHTWSNEKLIRDTSRKVRGSVATLQKEGKWLCSIPYGYVKDDFDKYKYYIDKSIAPYVKHIFDLYINGMGIKLIARTLTEENVPTPNMVRKMQAETKGKVYKKRVSSKWEPTTIVRILNNKFYTGTLILGKTKRRSINGKAIPQPEERHHIFINAHEAIIDMPTFNLAQEIMKKRENIAFRGNRSVRPNIFSTLLFCADCGKPLTSNSGGKQGDERTRYICKTYNRYGTAHCSSHAISEQEMKFVLLEFLESCRDNLDAIIKDLDKIIQAEIQAKGNDENNIIHLSKRLENVKNDVAILIEQKMRETMKNPSMVDMIDKMYDAKLTEKYKEIQIIEKQLRDQEDFAQNETNMKNNLNSALAIINEILFTKDITKKQMLLLVDKIVVYEDSGVDIYLKGDLHKITNNYFKVGHKKETLVKKYLCEFILQNPSKFITNDATVYIRDRGVRISYEKVSKILKNELLPANLVKIRPMNHGYELIGSEEELKGYLVPNIDAYIGGWLRHNSEVFATLTNISNWVAEILDDGKKLF
jgi:DNA invertase Pin-like site-specific DNA recombinase